MTISASSEFIEEVQSLLDEGLSLTKASAKLGVHHSKISRLIQRGLVEVYAAFDELEDIQHLSQNFEWFWEEDLLEKICDLAMDDFYVNMNIELGGNFLNVSKYTKEVYGSFYNYLKTKNKSPLLAFFYKTCTGCGQGKSLAEYSKKSKGAFGIDHWCSKCNCDYFRKYCADNPEFIKTHLNNRRARKRNLLDDLTVEQVINIMEEFGQGCALSGVKSDVHLDHVIPLSSGYGGTTRSNIIPLHKDLNYSKNDSNIFEWFEANRQRFELSQERFDNLIAWLASANAMTVEEYRDYGYWCHANPRSIDELEDAVI